MEIGTDAQKRFEEIKKKFEGSTKYMITIGYDEIEDLIEMVDLLSQVKRINYEETKEYEIESLKFKNEELSKQIVNYRYFPGRLKEEIDKLQDFINDFNFINNTECQAYKVAKEKLDLLKSIYYKY